MKNLKEVIDREHKFFVEMSSTPTRDTPTILQEIADSMRLLKKYHDPKELVYHIDLSTVPPVVRTYLHVNDVVSRMEEEQPQMELPLDYGKKVSRV